jgi:hypothetical protein
MFREHVVDEHRQAAALPNSLEDNLLIPPGRFRRAVGKVDFERLNAKQIVRFIRLRIMSLL